MTDESKIQLIQLQAKAYQDKKLDEFCLCYSQDVEIYHMPAMKQAVQGMDELKIAYAKRFTQNYTLKRENTFIVDEFVVEQETLLEQGSEKNIIAIYQIQNNKIQKVWFYM